MSAVIGVNATKIAAGGISNQLAKGTYDARVKCIVDSYEAAALASNSTITVGGTLPAGARVQDVVITFDALADVTLLVGDSADPNRYIDESAATAKQMHTEFADGVDYVVGTASGDNQVIITNTGVSAATGTIKIAIYYTQD